MPDEQRIAAEIATLLAQPQFASMLNHRNRFRNPGPENTTPEGLAHQKFLKRRNELSGRHDADPNSFTPADIGFQTARMIARNHLLLNPVQVLEVKGPCEFYRAFDGGITFKSAGTLGQCWFERSVGEAIWEATSRFSTEERRVKYMEFLRSANFILEAWNAMLQIARMSVPVGASVVVVRGRGDWKAARTEPRPPAPPQPGITLPSPPPVIRTPKDLEVHAKMMALPGTPQCVIPLFNDSWVQPLRRSSPLWPFNN